MNKKIEWSYVYLGLSFLAQLGALVFSKQAALVSQSNFSVIGIVTNPWYFLSLGCLGFQALVWPLALRRIALFKAYLFISLIFACVPVIAHGVFGEVLKPNHLISAGLIILGVVFVAAGGPKESK